MTTPDALQPMPCPLCGGNRIAPPARIGNDDPHTRSRFPEIGLSLCESCGLVHQNPRIPLEAMAGLYRATDDKAFATPSRDNPATAAENARRLAMIDAHLPGGLDGKRLLEIGCSNGAFLDLARARGAEVQGIEPSADNAAFCRDRRGISVFEGFLDEFPGPGPFDVVCHYFVLEHAFDPAAFLRAARALLRPGGAMFFEVPAIESFLAMPFAINLFPYQHIAHFDRASIRLLLARTGFDPLALGGPEACSKAYGMTLAARAAGEPAPPQPAADPSYARGLLAEYFTRKKENESALRQRAETFLRQFDHPVVAIYGAGENGRLLLRATPVRELAARVLFLDNSPSFVGTEIDGCPVHSPADLPALTPDVALLASIDYREEMERDLLARGFPPDRILRVYP